MELNLRPTTRDRMKKLKASNGNKDNACKDYSREQLMVKIAKYGRKGTLLTVALSLSLAIGFYQTMRGNLIPITKVGDHFGGVNSPHYQRPYDNISAQGYHDMLAHNLYPFHEGGFQGRPQARGGRSGGQGERGYYRPHEEVPRHETFDDFREDLMLAKHTVMATIVINKGKRL
ncbi:hypothetical protein M9H77_13091 [Catharanthus roseus]|uniref:Uncharacterized protein n=1 Tax=Catharanthus roseus TaxID=4058 RepID=A0ACC0BJ87_CATRO|nr:hypothetical protein M9H77_13091 [Catharanthus roseus]